MANHHSTIAAKALHFRVRNGNGCYLLAMITGKIRKERNCMEGVELFALKHVTKK